MNSWYSLSIWKIVSKYKPTWVREMASRLEHLSFPPHCSLAKLLYFLFKLSKFSDSHIFVSLSLFNIVEEVMDLVGSERWLCKWANQGQCGVGKSGKVHCGAHVCPCLGRKSGDWTDLFFPLLSRSDPALSGGHVAIASCPYPKGKGWGSWVTSVVKGGKYKSFYVFLYPTYGHF